MPRIDLHPDHGNSLDSLSASLACSLERMYRKLPDPTRAISLISRTSHPITNKPNLNPPQSRSPVSQAFMGDNIVKSVLNLDLCPSKG
jgi:hypothetical protein